MSQDPTQLAPAITPPPEANPREDAPLDFPDAEFGEVGPGDYATLGFLAGLEVHQQLRTKSKLFCRCPAGRYVESFDAEVLRHMRPTLSELGEYDGTALMEFKTRKEIVYRLDRSSVCTYEIDDTPPFEMDDEAIRMAIEIAQLLNLNLVSELHVMRKQYLDGSIPTGFQRTAMVGLGGSIPFVVPQLGVDRELRIRQLSLEEDSCREVSDIGHQIVFRTDRLGMPLTEAVTEPELHTPLEVRAAGRLLAEVARSTGKVRRGPGAGRQDVNVSVAGGRRVEIKGVYHHRGLPLLCHTEAFRQLNLLRIRQELRRRAVAASDLVLPDQGRPWDVSSLAIDASGVLRTSRYDPIRQGLDRGDTVCALKLSGFGGLLTHRTQPGITFAQEFSERVRVIACPVHRPFMTHSDVGEEALPARVWRELRKQLGASSDDTIVVLWVPEQDAETAVREVLARARESLVGIPAETRQGYADGTTGFERILPGADRMYPDTDTPPLAISDRTVETIRAQLPETPWARAERYMTLGLDGALAQRVARSLWAPLFDLASPTTPTTARRLAHALLKRVPFHLRQGRHVDVDDERWTDIVRAVESDDVRVEAFDRLVDVLLSRPEVSAEEILRSYRAQDDVTTELDQAIAEVVGRARDLPGRARDTLFRWTLGEVMPRFLGRVDPRDVHDRLAAGLGVEVGENVP